MADIEKEKVIYGLNCRSDLITSKKDCEKCGYYRPRRKVGKCACDEMMRDAIELLKEQQSEIESLKAEKNRIIEQIESEIHRLFKERGCVKDDVGRAQYQWLINGYQSALDMIKDGEQE